MRQHPQWARNRESDELVLPNYTHPLAPFWASVPVMENINLIQEYKKQVCLSLFTDSERAKICSLIVYLFEEGVRLPYEWARLGAPAYVQYWLKHQRRDPQFC